MKAIGSTQRKTSGNRRLKLLRKHLKPLRRSLLASGAVKILMSYEGCDGIVDFNEVEAWSNDWQLTNAELTTFHAELRVRFSELLQLRSPAWEMELGGSGEIMWDLSRNRLRHTHDTNVLEYFSITYEGL